MHARSLWSVRLRRLALAAAVVGSSSFAAEAQAPQAQAAAQADADPWPSLVQQIFDAKPLENGDGVLALSAPYRALDAAVVPITIRTLLLPGDARTVRRITLVIDGNPSPLAAIFTLGEHSGIDFIATRVRVDDYTNVHAVAELSDGKLYAVSSFVKAAGGCSAPALKQASGAIPLGTMRFRELPHSTKGDAQPGEREIQLMIRHPNYSGMQMDQVSRLYIPAEFIKSVQVWQGKEMMVSVESGISISENPEFRFHFKPNGDEPFRAEAVDSDDKPFQAEWKVGTAS
jgi:sulfur-oxidizing protein SoxY